MNQMSEPMHSSLIVMEILVGMPKGLELIYLN
jgi:hypothetical protein